MPIPIIVPILGVGGGLLWWMNRGHKTPDPATATSTEWQDAIADAIASGDPAKMRALATALDQAGYHDAANDLRSQAAQLEKMKGQGQGAVVPEQHNQVSVGPSPGMGGGPGPIKPADVSAQISAVQSFADYLRTAGKPPGAAVFNSHVADFQRQEGLKPDGKYGPKTAKRIAVYRVVPPKPWYWPRSGTAASVADFRSYMLQRSQEDPSHRDEWLEASKVP